jgi:hypothetical protein
MDPQLKMYGILNRPLFSHIDSYPYSILETGGAIEEPIWLQ